MTDLPTGWAQASLGKLGAEVRGSIQPDPSRTYELYSVPTYPSGRPEVVVGSEIGSNKRVVEPDDLLLCKINPRINRVWSVSKPTADIEQLASPEYLVLRTGDPDLTRYLMWYLRSPRFRDWVTLSAEGATGSHTRVKSGPLLEQQVPIPPRAEQARIVAVIEEQCSRLDAGVATVARVRQNLKRLRASVLRAAISGRLVAPGATEPSLAERLSQDDIHKPLYEDQPANWATTSISAIAQVTSGATPLRSRKEYWQDGSIPWITSTLVNEETVSQAREFVTPLALQETPIKLMPTGTILVAMYGEGQTRGRCSELLIEATTNQACAAIVLHDQWSFVRPFLKLVLMASYEVNRRLSAGGVQPNLSVGIIKNLVVCLPPPGEQERICDEADRRLASIGQVDKELEGNARRLSSLRSSILTRAFSGKLVTQNPSDESASALLDKISADGALSDNHVLANTKRHRRKITT